MNTKIKKKREQRTNLNNRIFILNLLSLLENSTFVLNPKFYSLDLQDELEALTDQLLEVSMKLRAAESELKTLKSEQVKELSKFSHNLKNPVGVISSFAEMLQGSPSLDEEKRAKYLEIIQSSSKFSLALVNSFQEYNKLKNNQVPFELEPVNYAEFVQEIVSDFNSIAKKRNQTLDFSSKCNGSGIVNIDKHQMRNAITNVLDNASRFSSENSVISVEIEETENSIVTRISDTGIGVSAADIPNLTNPFFTVNTYDEYKVKCIGLGLTKTKLILNQFSGELSFSSLPENGSKVEIKIKL